jgi:hypothetical protein
LIGYGDLALVFLSAFVYHKNDVPRQTHRRRQQGVEEDAEEGCEDAKTQAGVTNGARPQENDEAKETKASVMLAITAGLKVAL